MPKEIEFKENLKDIQYKKGNDRITNADLPCELKIQEGGNIADGT